MFSILFSQEARSLRAAQHQEAQCLAEAVRLVELGAGPEAAAAARDAETKQFLMEEKRKALKEKIKEKRYHIIINLLSIIIYNILYIIYYYLYDIYLK